MLAPTRLITKLLLVHSISIAIVCVAGFLVASAFSMWFYLRLISPIHQLTRSAQLISGGDYSLRVSTYACGEIAALAKTINAMADGLERGERLTKNFIADTAHELRTVRIADSLDLYRNVAQSLIDRHSPAVL